MKEYKILAFIALPIMLTACGGGSNVSSDTISSEENSSLDIMSSEISSQVSGPLVKAPSGIISALRGNRVNLKNYLIVDDSVNDFDVKFTYTFSGYGDMNESGAKEFEGSGDVQEERFLLQYCGSYQINFVATIDSSVVSEEDANFTIVSEDTTKPVIVGEDTINFNNGVLSEEDILSNYTVNDEYYVSLSLCIEKLDGETYTQMPEQLTSGNHVFTLCANDGLGNETHRDISVSIEQSIEEDISVLAEPGGYVIHDFDRINALGNYLASDVGSAKIIDNGITNKSLEVDYSTATTEIFFSEVAMNLNGDFKVSFDYKITSEKMPSYFCVGLHDGVNQNNKENYFMGKTNKEGTYENTWTNLNGTYRFRFFNFAVDQSKIVIDNIKITNVTVQVADLSVLKNVGGKICHDFDSSLPLGNYESSNSENTFIFNGVDAIEGKSLKVDNAFAGIEIAFKSAVMSLEGSYKVSFDYKILSENLPNYFCVGLHDGANQNNHENYFSGKTNKEGKYESTWDNLKGTYYLRFFNLFNDGSIMVVDNITIERTK